MDALHVIADDLTGACDVAAALLPWPAGVVVYPDGLASPALPERAGLVVRNTQSRTLPPATAAERVRETLAPATRGSASILLKKIDTGLRGPLGAEIDAAMDALGAPEAFVLPAIPEVDRTTVRGEQLVAGVPVHQTAFADDPHNPVRDSRVATVIESTARRAASAIELDVVRARGGLRRALDARRTPIVVLDAETQADLARCVRALLARPRPLLLVGSIGLARALRCALPLEASRAVTGMVPEPGRPASTGGVLVVLGSAHPTARRQRDHACRRSVLDAVIEVSPERAEVAGRQAAALVAEGRTAALAAPDLITRGREVTIATALREAVVTALARGCLSGLVLVGGETAFHVLAGLGHPPLAIESRPGPLVVHARVAAGPHRGLPVITKGGSSGEPELLASLVLGLGGRGA